MFKYRFPANGQTNGLSTASKWGAMISLSLLLAACYEVAPQQVEERINIHRDGKIDVSYSGTFNDMNDFLAAAGAPKEEIATREKTVHDLLANSASIDEVRLVGPHRFFARWHVRADLQSEQLPALLKRDEREDSKIPSLVHLSQINELELGYKVESNLSDEDRQAYDETMREPSPLQGVLTKYVKAFQGTVTIEADDDQVGESNAASKHAVKSGRSIHQWSFRETDRAPIKFAFYLGEHDAQAFKLLNAPAGTNCMALIGEQCKCGPFVLAERRGPTAFAPYEIVAGDKIVHGCTNKEGETESVAMIVTGECVFKPLTKSDADTLCKKPVSASK